MALTMSFPTVSHEYSTLVYSIFIQDDTLPDRELLTSRHKKFNIWWTAIIILCMFIILLLEVIGPDMAMISCLTLLMAAKVVTIKEGLEGFSNDGVLTVFALFPLTAAIAHTGALDYYIAKLLGRPKTNADAQLRLLVPIIFASAFIHNTPLVMIMIPIIQRWSKNTGVSVQQLMIPLSYGSILGGTCTLLGTSTNVIVQGLYNARFSKNKDFSPIGMFDIAPYGVPSAMVGMVYVLLISPWLLPGGSRFCFRSKSAYKPVDSIINADVLLGARLTKWSPAAGRSVKRSGLRDTGGIYLVSVYRAATGNVHRAVGQDFILNVGDILYFTGLVEGFAQFCQEHGLEVVTDETNQIEESNSESSASSPSDEDKTALITDPSFVGTVSVPVSEGITSHLSSDEIGATKESLALSDDNDRWRVINSIQDAIRGLAPFDNGSDNMSESKVVVVSDHSTQPLVVVGISTTDRPGLLLDISQAFKRLGINFRSTEATVVGQRSLSLWRCEVLSDGVSDIEQIWSVIHELLDVDKGIEAIKHRGLKVVRAVVSKESSLIGLTAAAVDFRKKYKAAIIAINQPSGQVEKVSNATFGAGDVLVLQTNDDSPLLRKAPDGFYSRHVGKSSSTSSLVQLLRKNPGCASPVMAHDIEGQLEDSKSIDPEIEACWRDLQVIFPTEGDSTGREFLGAMRVSPKSAFVKKSAARAGLTDLPGVYLVSIERPSTLDINNGEGVVGSEQSLKTIAVANDEPLATGDILWFAGSATAIGDLRKIPGLTQYVSDEIKKINEKVHNRHLVEAVVARNGPLVGKTVKESQIRTKYGAAVIAVHRQGKRIHDYPGRIKLLAGDVLLLEAGPTFVKKNAEGDHAFALLTELKDSAPPRLRLFIPTLIIVVASIAVYTAELMSLLISTLLADIAVVLLGVMSQQEVRDSIDWNLYLTIASALGVGKAMSSSGVAGAIANGLVKFGRALDIGVAGIYAAIYLATGMVSSVLTNNAAAALAFPIAAHAAEQYNADKKLMAFVVMFGASDYMTPFGYTTNLIVYGPGGYSTMDYLRFGAPLQLLLSLYTIALLAYNDPWLWWIYTGIPVTVASIVMVHGPKVVTKCWGKVSTIFRK